jgi:hypothetical protein
MMMADDENETATKSRKRKADVPAGNDLPPENLTEESAVIDAKPGEVEEALADLGQAIAREEGNYDLSEEAHQSAIKQAEQAASEFVLRNKSLVWDARDFLLDQIKRRPKPWGGCSGGEKADIGAACEHAATELVRKIAEEMASGGQPSVRVLLGQITLGDDIKLNGKVRLEPDDDEDRAVLFLHRAQGKHVMLTLASKDEHKENERPAPGVPAEEPELSFEAGSEEIDNDDLAEAGGAERGPHEPDDQELRDSEQPIVRTNLKTGMIEQLDDGFEDDPEAKWSDLRQATPDELAAERDRVADFEAEPAQ